MAESKIDRMCGDPLPELIGRHKAHLDREEVHGVEQDVLQGIAAQMLKWGDAAVFGFCFGGLLPFSEVLGDATHSLSLALLSIVRNACEHAPAVRMAYHNRAATAIAIAVGSIMQEPSAASGTEPEACRKGSETMPRPGRFSVFCILSWVWALLSACHRSWAETATPEFAIQPLHFILPFYLLTLLSSLPPISRSAATLCGKERLWKYVFNMYSAESFAMVLLGLGVWLQSVALLALAMGIVCQFGQVFRVQRKTTGTEAKSELERMLLVSGVFVHHVGSWLLVQNYVTLFFMTAWRFFSISGHMLVYVKDTLRAPIFVVHIIGWTRVVTCLFVFQPVAICMVVGQALGYWEAGSWHEQLALGLKANAPGVATYALFRGTRMNVVRGVREELGLERCNTANPLNSYGRQKPILELEILLLYVIAAVLVLCPCAPRVVA